MSKYLGPGFSAFASTALLAIATTGCSAQTLEEFEGKPVALAVNYTPGRALYVNGLNGEIRLEAGTAGQVHVRFKPFTFDGYEKEDEAREAIANDLHIALTEDSSGNVHASVTKDPGSGSLGAHMLVSLPPEFDNLIQIENKNGEVEIDHVAQANRLIVDNNGAGDCLIAGAPTIRDTDVQCGFDVRVTDVADKVIVQSKEIGDVTVSIASIAAGSGNGDIRAENGDVSLTVPASTSDFSVQAAAYGGGTVNVGSAPAGCQVTVAAENSKTLSCGAGPNLTVIAGNEDSLSYDVSLGYR